MSILSVVATWAALAVFYRVAWGAVRCHHGSNLFCERYDISFHYLQQCDTSLYSNIRHIAIPVAKQKQARVDL